jgi:head-tail adaptor
MARLDIGMMKHLASVQAPTEIISATGEVTKSWVDVTQAFMSLQPLSSKEQLALDRMDATVTHRIGMWANADLKLNHRLVLGTRAFYITSIVESEDSMSIEILAEEKQP